MPFYFQAWFLIFYKMVLLKTEAMFSLVFFIICGVLVLAAVIAMAYHRKKVKEAHRPKTKFYLCRNITPFKSVKYAVNLHSLKPCYGRTGFKRGRH